MAALTCCEGCVWAYAPGGYQLQTWQRPAAHEHSGMGGAMRRGPQRRTHSRAADSLRSLVPPGQHRRSIVEISREVAGSDRAEIDLMCVSMRGSAKPSAIAYRDTARGGGSTESGLPAHREPAWRGTEISAARVRWPEERERDSAGRAPSAARS